MVALRYRRRELEEATVADGLSGRRVDGGRGTGGGSYVVKRGKRYDRLPAGIQELPFFNIHIESKNVVLVTMV